MTKITAAEVQRLRMQTGAGMMDCKKALMENDGDSEKAIEFLRKKGQKVALKRAEREANEGIVLAKTNNDRTFVVNVMVNCETDFVAKNEEFRNFVINVIDKAIKRIGIEIKILLIIYLSKFIILSLINKNQKFKPFSYSSVRI